MRRLVCRLHTGRSCSSSSSSDAHVARLSSMDCDFTFTSLCTLYTPPREAINPGNILRLFLPKIARGLLLASSKKEPAHGLIPPPPRLTSSLSFATCNFLHPPANGFARIEHPHSGTRPTPPTSRRPSQIPTYPLYSSSVAAAAGCAGCAMGPSYLRPFLALLFIVLRRGCSGFSCFGGTARGAPGVSFLQQVGIGCFPDDEGGEQGCEGG